MPTLARIDSHAVTGVVSPKLQEAMIRETWAAASIRSPIVALARKLIRSVVLAPLGWLLLAPTFATRLLGFLPGLAFLTIRYTLTNRRLMIRRGMKPVPVSEIALDQIEDIRNVLADYSDFFFTGSLEVVGKGGQVVFKMTGVPEPEAFRQAILNARNAWGPILAASK
jgi:hypothetical protein